MLRHYYTLTHLSRELSVLSGAMLIECFTQERNILILVFEKDNTDYFLECSLDGKLGALFLRPEFSRARRNSTTIFPNSVGIIVQSVSLHPSDRIITLDCESQKIHFLMFGGASGNILLTDTSGKILDSFKSLENKNINLNINNDDDSVRQYQDFRMKNFLSGTPILTTITKYDVFLGKIYAGEACHRAIISTSSPFDLLSTKELTTLHSEIEALKKECLTTKTYYVLGYGDNRHPVFSLVLLNEYSVIEYQSSSVSEAIRRRIALTRQREKYNSLRINLEKKLHRVEKRLQSSIFQMENDAKAEERATNYKSWAELLLAQPNGRQLHGNTITVDSWTGETIEIPLDERLTLLENAEKYFAKTKSAADATKVRAERLPSYKSRLAKIEELLAKIEETSTLQEVLELQEHIEQIAGKSMKEQTEHSKYREFALEEGFTVYVGKNAANNDELTMRFAKPNDIWFHARGVSGSHAVLKVKAGTKPPKHVIEQAASIAAYYSNARNAKYTPVAYTLKKYIRKPKGANPGAVIMEREEVIMVSPKLPAGMEEKE
ncbi:MAG: DUF814 domain-containing protein [Bacteroidetes bacterium]|nr:DUF814 domain-containing protein [Bacteroidota bacterium]